MGFFFFIFNNEAERLASLTVPIMEDIKRRKLK
jgi:hypothetical protein